MLDWNERRPTPENREAFRSQPTPWNDDRERRSFTVALAALRERTISVDGLRAEAATMEYFARCCVEDIYKSDPDMTLERARSVFATSLDDEHVANRIEFGACQRALGDIEKDCIPQRLQTRMATAPTSAPGREHDVERMLHVLRSETVSYDEVRYRWTRATVEVRDPSDRVVADVAHARKLYELQAARLRGLASPERIERRYVALARSFARERDA